MKTINLKTSFCGLPTGVPLEVTGGDERGYTVTNDGNIFFVPAPFVASEEAPVEVPAEVPAYIPEPEAPAEIPAEIRSTTVQAEISEDEIAALAGLLASSKAEGNLPAEAPKQPAPAIQDKVEASTPEAPKVPEQGENEAPVAEVVEQEVVEQEVVEQEPEAEVAIVAETTAGNSFSLRELCYDWDDSYPDAVVEAYSTDEWSELGARLIPEVDPNFKWSQDVVFALYWGHITKSNAFLVGMPGTGKTEACQQWAALLNQR